MRSNRLRLNLEKTDFLWCATRRRCIHLDTAELSVCGVLIRPSTSVRDLGVLLESDLSMRRHVAWTVGCCFRQLRLIRSCIKSLPLGAACEGSCRRFSHFEGGPLQQPPRRRACVPPGRTPVGPQCRSEAHPQQEEV